MDAQDNNQPATRSTAQNQSSYRSTARPESGQRETSRGRSEQRQAEQGRSSRRTATRNESTQRSSTRNQQRSTQRSSTRNQSDRRASTRSQATDQARNQARERTSYQTRERASNQERTRTTSQTRGRVNDQTRRQVNDLTRGQTRGRAAYQGSSSSRAATSTQSRSGFIIIALAALVVLGVIAGIWLVMSSQSNANRHQDDTMMASPAGKAETNAGQVQTRSAKRANAEETVDANGVVHGKTADGITYILYGRGQADNASNTISLAAVGDVFATNMNFPILEEYGKRSGLDYDFEPYYQAVQDEIGTYDIRFINQETPCAGNGDGYEYSGYPVFNTPDSSIHALADVGFNVANFNSNHTWDMDSYGIERSHELFAEHPEVMVVGSYSSQDDRDAIHLVERGGMAVALLSYSYGDNMMGSDPNAFPNQYYTCEFDKSVMKAEIERAQQVADAVVVYMHWGSEYTTTPSDQQLEYAQFLADLDVDLVIGSHAHIMQPIRYYTSPSGKQVPVVFGLSDFITGWTLTDTILSGMFTCNFTWENGALNVTDCAYTPAIEWSDGGDTYVRFLKDMSDEEIAVNTRTEDVDDDLSYLHTFIDDLGMEVPVIW